MISKSNRGRKAALVALMAACLLASGNARALALGRVTVQSALGDPLRAEIELADINPAEAATIQPAIALPDAFKAAGVDYNAALTGAQLSLQRHSDGRAFLRLSSDRSVSEPFIDLIVDIRWASGRIVRDYTLLFDPPNLRAPIAPLLPQAAVETTLTAPPPAMAGALAPASAAPADTVRPSGVPDEARRVRVRAGDSASMIALASKPAPVSLDQMLVAMLRGNADAFVDSNPNRLRAGALLTIPTAEQALAIAPEEARQTIVAQSRDFDAYRARLAGNAPNLSMDTAQRTASGSIQTRVEEKKAAALSPDKLTLSTGTVALKGSEEQVAQDKTSKDAARRQAELAQNIKDLASIGAATATPAASLSASSDTPPPSVSAASSASAADATAAVSAVPALQAAIGASAATAAAIPGPGLLNTLIESQDILVAAGGLVALLAALGLYRVRQRRRRANSADSMLESRMGQDSFFDASGGQRVDTRDEGAAASALAYSPSELDAAEEVDPVAEAEVYLAYGRDTQAEEILTQALRTHYGRIAVHQKLLDIYALRRDQKAFEQMARQAFELAGDHGQDWERICAQGMALDPGNPLYHARPGEPATLEMTDLDLDLDFSLDEQSAAPPPGPGQTVVSPAAPSAAAGFDPEPTPSVASAQELAALGLESLESGAQHTGVVKASPGDAVAPRFDFGSLSLELEPLEAEETHADDALATKLALAEEFVAIGDRQGARALIEEVLAEASGDMLARAQRALGALA